LVLVDTPLGNLFSDIHHHHHWCLMFDVCCFLFFVDCWLLFLFLFLLNNEIYLLIVIFCYFDVKQLLMFKSVSLRKIWMNWILKLFVILSIKHIWKTFISIVWNLEVPLLKWCTTSSLYISLSSFFCYFIVWWSLECETFLKREREVMIFLYVLSVWSRSSKYQHHIE
jgi:hypothetical protein